MKIFHYDTPIQKPYALYIHGLGSSAASGTKSSLARSLDAYEWLSPEITHNPFESLDILNEWIAAFQPTLIAGTSMGGLLAMYVNSPNAIKVVVNPCIEIERVLRKIGYQCIKLILQMLTVLHKKVSPHLLVHGRNSRHILKASAAESALKPKFGTFYICAGNDMCKL